MHQPHFPQNRKTFRGCSTVVKFYVGFPMKKLFRVIFVKTLDLGKKSSPPPPSSLNNYKNEFSGFRRPIVDVLHSSLCSFEYFTSQPPVNHYRWDVKREKLWKQTQRLKNPTLIYCTPAHFTLNISRLSSL